jgi:hypothetical protein
MAQIIKVDEQGALHLPAQMLGVRPHTRYIVERQGNALILRPATEHKQPFSATATPEARVARLKEWAEMERPDAPNLPDEVLRRENMYD